MSNLIDLLNKLKIESVSLQSYIYYDKTNGKIHKISSTNEIIDEYDILSVVTEDVMPMLTGQKRTDEYFISYDISAKQIMLKETAYEDSHITASTMCYQLPVINETDSSASQLYSSDSSNKQKISMQPEYVGVHVDVWYDELSHLSGQHVWLNNTVYKLLNDQAADTQFAIDNVEMVVTDVKLHNDQNKVLDTVTMFSDGDLVLNNNKIYSVNISQFNIRKEYDIIVCQDTINKVWNIMINPITKKFLVSKGYNPNETLYFSVTSKYDPNILYRSLEFNVGNLVADVTSVIPFIHSSEDNSNDISVYTAKYFNNYAHEVI
jgi:hypothetical protein